MEVSSPFLLVFLVDLVHLVSLVYPVGLVQPNKQDRPNRLDGLDNAVAISHTLRIPRPHPPRIRICLTNHVPCSRMCITMMHR